MIKYINKFTDSISNICCLILENFKSAMKIIFNQICDRSFIQSYSQKKIE